MCGVVVHHGIKELFMENKTTLIIGANSDIAKSIASRAIGDKYSQLVVVSRNTDFYQQAKFVNTKVISIEHYDDATVKQAVETIKEAIVAPITRIFICHGVLHNDTCHPEKRMEDFSVESFQSIMMANTITPMLWLKYLTSFISGKSPCKVVIFNARVGSISENELGGWYSYRTSKAAMNMLIKTAAIELARRAKNVKLISFHPGTTDTPLSKPFQKNVPKGKLFIPDFVAKQLLAIVEESLIDGEASYLDWQGKSIGW